ncbi:hypothetical protein SAMN02799630_03665 [Paenibacillus sp. UNCCL117]|nr:hypothetical protein SAMN04488602_109132 [Paenibacillus sp. cl123]SFW49491.1 hypothetical protein SAMN02799630_03665 [Paenibacillus sp. UNCCL117]
MLLLFFCSYRYRAGDRLRSRESEDACLHRLMMNKLEKSFLPGLSGYYEENAAFLGKLDLYGTTKQAEMNSARIR